MSLAILAAVLKWVQELRIEACQASQVFGIHFVGLAFVGVDEPQLPSVGHKHLVAALLQEPANPGRVGARFYGDAHRRLLGGEASSEGLGAGPQPTLLHDLATLLVDEAEVGVPVAEVHSGCRLWLLFATIHGGPILLSGLLKPVNLCRPLRVLRRGSAFSSHLPRIPLPRTPVN